MTKVIEFDVYEQYRAEGTQQAEVINAYRKREQEASEAHAALLAEYQQKIEDSVKNGVDATKALDALDAKIAEAERTLSRRKTERAAAHAARGKQTTTATDVIHAYINDYAPQVKKAVMTPVNERLEKARALILSAVVDVYQADDDYSDLFQQVAETSRGAHRSGETSVHYSLSKPFNVSEIQRYVYKLVDEMEAARRSRQLPANVDYIEGVK